MRWLLSIIFISWSGFVYAQQALSPLVEHVSISGQDCRRMTKAKPVPDATYKPGVDVYGHPVAAADLPGSAGLIKAPQVIEFDYTINPMTYGGSNSLASKGLEAGNSMMTVAHIRYDMGSNNFTLNGQPLNANDQAAIAQECSKHLGH